jgi:parallel beta-helix repeat protein
LGTNLGSSIQSIALYIDTDRGAQTFLISNIIACNARSSADSLNLQSLIGKNIASEKWWACIQSINGTRVILDQDTSYSPTSAANNTGGINVTYRGYDGVSETTNLFKRETIKTPIATTSATNNNIQSYTADSGLSDTVLVNLQFGFDRTNMSVRTGETFFDGLNGWGVGLSIISRNYLKLTNVGFFRYLRGFYFQGTIASTFDSFWFSGNTEIPMYLFQIRICNLSNIYSMFNRGEGVRLDVTSQRNILSNIFTSSNGSRGIYFGYSSNNLLINSTANNNALTGYGMGHGIRNIIKNCSFTDNHNAAIDTADSADNNLFLQCTTSNNSHSITCFGTGNNYVKNCILNEASEALNFNAYSDGRTIFINNDNSNNNYIIYTDNGTIYNTVAVRYSNSGFAWALAPTSSTLRTSSYPLALSIAKVAVNANSLVIVRAWMRRTNTGLTTGLRIKGDQIAGVPNDITSYISGAADTWEQVTLNFTPTEAGVVEILAECWGGTTFTAYVDDISITQV